MLHLVSLDFTLLSAWSTPHFVSIFKRLRCCSSLVSNNLVCAFLKHKFHMQDVSVRQHKTQTRWISSGYELKAIMRTANNKRNILLIAPSRKTQYLEKDCSFNSQIESDTAAKYQPNKQQATNLLGMLSPPKWWLMTRSNANCLHWIPGRVNPCSSTFLVF